MELIIKDIPKEYLALKINYIRQMLDKLPDPRLHVYTIKGVPTQMVVVDGHRYRYRRVD